MDLSLRQLYQYQNVRDLCDKFGPAVWRLPPILRKRLVREQDVPRLPDTTTWWFQAEENVVPRRFACLKNNMPTLGHRISARAFRCAPRYVAELKSAWLVGEYATPVTSPGRILLTSFRDQPRFMGLDPHVDLELWIGPTEDGRSNVCHHSRPLCSFVNRLETNYFHWMIEWCGQVEGLFHYRDVTGITPEILVRDDGPSYIQESLQLLGYDSAAIIKWQSDRSPLAVDRLVVTSIPGVRVSSSPRSLHWLRRRFLASLDIRPGELKPKRNIYIPRKVGGWRFIVNEAEVCKTLLAHGFEILSPDSFSLRDQIGIFSEANIIVGMHGAGLTNILFAPGAKLLELTGGYGGGDYYSLASGLGQQYSYLRCQPDGDNIRVDTAKLMQAVNSLAGTGR